MPECIRGASLQIALGTSSIQKVMFSPWASARLLTFHAGPARDVWRIAEGALSARAPRTLLI
jgi:hypothetical protein